MYPIAQYALYKTLYVLLSLSLLTLAACAQLQIPTAPPGGVTPEWYASLTPSPRASSTTTPDAALTADAARFRETVLAFQTQSAAENATERAATARPTETATLLPGTPYPTPDLAVLSPANISRLEEIAAFTHPDIRIAYLHPSGLHLIITTSTKKIIYRTDALLAIRTYDNDYALNPFLVYAYSDDGTLVAMARPDGTIAVDNLETGEIQYLDGHPEGITALAISPDNRLVASLGVDDGNLILWDTISGQPAATFFTRFHFNYARTGNWVAFSPDSSKVAAYAVESSSILIWDVADLIGDAAPPAYLALSEHIAPPLSFLFSPDWQTVAWTEHDKLQFMDSLGNPLGEPIQHEDIIMLPQFTSDGTRLVLANAETIGASYAGVLLTYEIATQERVQTLAGPDFVSEWAFSPDESEIAAGYANGRLYLWDYLTGQLRFELLGHTARIQTAIYSPDGRMLATASEDGSVRLWGTSSGGELVALPINPDAGQWLAFTPDGKLLVVVSTDGRVVFYGVRE